jgi:hypothetical protein
MTEFEVPILELLDETNPSETLQALEDFPALREISVANPCG